MDEPRPVGPPEASAGGARRVHGDRGAASAELVGVLFVIVLVMGALVGAASSGTLGSAYENLFCRAFSWFGTDCSSSPAPDAQDDRKPEQACTVESGSTTRTIGVTVVVDVDGGGTITTERMSDGTYRVTFEGKGGVGIGLGVGGGLDVTVNDHTFGGTAVAGISGGGELFGGSTWTFDNEGDASRLASYLESQLTYATTPVAGPFMRGWDMLFGDDYTPPAPTEFFGAVGVYGDASAGASSLVTSANAAASAATQLGARYNTETNETTVYYKVSAEAGATGTSLVPGGVGTASASGEVELVVALTVGPDGEYLTNVSVEGVAHGEYGYDTATIFGGDQGGDSGGTLYNASVDLTDRESALIAYDLLRSAGVPMPPSRYVTVPGTDVQTDLPVLSAAERFVSAAAERGQIYRLGLEGTGSTGFGINGSADVGIGVGVRYEASESSRNLTSAEYFDGSRWVPWVECYS